METILFNSICLFQLLDFCDLDNVVDAHWKCLEGVILHGTGLIMDRMYGVARTRSISA